MTYLQVGTDGQGQGSTLPHFRWVLIEDDSSGLYLGPIADRTVSQTHFLSEVTLEHACVQAPAPHPSLPSYCK